MWWEESQVTSPAQPFTGHQRGSGIEGNPRNLASNCKRGAQDPPSHLGTTFVATLHASWHNVHEWVWVSKYNYYQGISQSRVFSTEWHFKRLICLNYTILYGRQSGLIISRLDCRWSMDQVSAPARGIVLCSWARHLTLTLPLSTQVYKWVLVNLVLLGVTLQWASIPYEEEKNSQLLHDNNNNNTSLPWNTEKMDKAK